MNSTSQICTTRKQSERLLALGLKPETADCYRFQIIDDDCEYYVAQLFLPYMDRERMLTMENIYPAWSLYRLLEMMPKYLDEKENMMLMVEPPIITYYDTRYKGQYHFTSNPEIFNKFVSMIDWLIQNNHFNKEYLKGGQDAV